jgi:hypothetical protein
VAHHVHRAICRDASRLDDDEGPQQGERWRLASEQLQELLPGGLVVIDVVIIPCGDKRVRVRSNGPKRPTRCVLPEGVGEAAAFSAVAVAVATGRRGGLMMIPSQEGSAAAAAVDDVAGDSNVRSKLVVDVIVAHTIRSCRGSWSSWRSWRSCNSVSIDLVLVHPALVQLAKIKKRQG